MPHFAAAYTSARWITRSEEDSRDVVQEAFLRAFHFFEGFRGGDARAWLFSIIRNTCYTWLRKNRSSELMTEFDEALHSEKSTGDNPEQLELRRADSEMLRAELETLPAEIRVAIVLREMDGLSYRESADLTGVSMARVMSRLPRRR